ncbi:thioredoxin family protein [Desulfopila sp. IMCC35008]|uniref:thioredoxin family protein n=1 Tax=Desulfopila sp. IMCC35008 TaxID=2653858 RepID=UPI0013D3A737|nr:thioredoxin family protein [Desulfopila sp. IMCC35008]
MDSQIITLQEDNYRDHVQANDCLVVFHKSKCPNCKVLLKVMDKCKASHPDIAMACINSEENDVIVKELEVSRVPSILVYKKGDVAARKAGIMKPIELAELYLSA